VLINNYLSFNFSDLNHKKQIIPTLPKQPLFQNPYVLITSLYLFMCVALITGKHYDPDQGQ
ncbi:hypothetical protein, partial [Erwinia amylovora]|uniref:hypothetical protein n=1 Tax=Erwinia amylovora TaxID=552 RepID=UPI0019639605